MATINYEPHVLLRWGGRLGEDTWSNGLRIRHPDQDPAGMIAWSKAHLGAIADVVKSWHRDTVSYHNGLATLAWVKLNAVGSNGRYLDVGQTTLKEVQPAQVPNGSPPLIAPQLACASAGCPRRSPRQRTAPSPPWRRSARRHPPTSRPGVNRHPLRQQ